MINIKGITLFLVSLLFLVPVSVLAHGTEEQHQQEVATTNLINYSFIASAVLLVIGIILLFLLNNRLKTISVKKNEGRIQRDKLKGWLKVSQWTSLLGLLALLITGIFAIVNNNKNDEIVNAVEFMHIHGLGITNDGEEIYVPAHDGLKVYKDGGWSNAPGEKHDYMGFSMVDDGFYSSGHPGPGSKLENPFGVVKTTDMGRNLEILDLYKEIDFHGMAVGYNSHAIYVLNPEVNSRMDETGLYYSLDDTQTWTKSKMEGITGQLSSIAVHPSNESIIALGTNTGAFLSMDFGQSFEQVLDVPTTAVSFSPNGDLVTGSIGNEITLIQFDLDTMEPTEINIPHLTGENAIGYIAVNPQNENQIVFTTFEKDIYLSTNVGKTWDQVATKGKGSAVLSDSTSTESKEETHGDHNHHGNVMKEELPLEVGWSFDQNPEENKEQRLKIQIKDLAGKSIEDFDVEHEKLMHLIIISEDLSVFQHLHPEYKGNGLFTIKIKFPKGGQYQLLADVVPNGYKASTVTEWVNVDGDIDDEELVIDDSLTKIIDGKRVSLSFDQIQTNKDLNMTFTIHDNETGEPITDLKPYLGAIGHVVIVSEDGEQYIHSHPMNNDTSGPKAEFMTSFPENGLYKIWGQFNHQGEIVTVPFVIEVP